MNDSIVSNTIQNWLCWNRWNSPRDVLQVASENNIWWIRLGVVMLWWCTRCEWVFIYPHRGPTQNRRKPCLSISGIHFPGSTLLSLKGNSFNHIPLFLSIISLLTKVLTNELLTPLWLVGDHAPLTLSIIKFVINYALSQRFWRIIM